MATYAQYIQELQQEGERWRITVRGLGQASLLQQDMFPSGVGAPYGVTIAEDVIQDQPELSGSFLIGGINSDTLPHMDPDYAQKFRDAGLVPLGPLWKDQAPEEGMIRTWMVGLPDPVDITVDEWNELYADHYVDVDLPDDLTVWDTIDNVPITLKYANGMEYPLTLNVVDQAEAQPDRMLNHSSYLVIPADDALNPVLNQFTMRNLYDLRVKLLQVERERHEEQIKIGELVYAFAKIIKENTKARGGSAPALAGAVMSYMLQAQRAHKN